MSIEKTMSAVGFYEGLPIEEAHSFVDAKLPLPKVYNRDLLVQVKAVSINPVDTKLRQKTKKQNKLKVLGFDAVGEVTAIGDDVQNFQVGDRVFYAGTSQRSGSNQAFQLVDERIVALAPKNLSDEKAAALPLTAITAFELLFEKFGVISEKNANIGKNILIINGAGGVGSILSQLASWAGLEVFATSSPKNFNWLKSNKVSFPIDYHGNLKENLSKKDTISFDYIAVLFDITAYFDQIKTLIKPCGHIGTIVGISSPLDIGIWKNHSVSFDWEYMFAKTDFDYHIESQGKILRWITDLVEQGELRSTLTKTYSTGIHAKNIKQATKDVESGHMKGKVVVSGPFLNDGKIL